MKWVVTKSDGVTVALDSRRLTQLLIQPFSEGVKKDLETISSELTESLQSNSHLAGMDAYQILYTGALLGYYYKIFLTKNQVEVQEDDKDEPHYSDE